jgi:hypothetical protein
MVGYDEQVGGCAEGGVRVGEEARVHMSVWTDER